MVPAPVSHSAFPRMLASPLPQLGFVPQRHKHKPLQVSLFLRQLPVSQAFFMVPPQHSVSTHPHPFFSPRGWNNHCRGLWGRDCRGPIHNGLNAEAATFRVLASPVCSPPPAAPRSSPPGCTPSASSVFSVSTSPSSLRLPKDFNGLAPQDSLQKILPNWRALPLFSAMLVSSFNLAWANSLRRDSHTQVSPLPPAVLVSLPGSWILLIFTF